MVSDQLANHFPTIMDVGFTAGMEQNLDDIARGEKEWVPVLRDFYSPFQEALTSAAEEMPRVRVAEPSDETCDLCGQPMVIKTSRFGRFLACTLASPNVQARSLCVKKWVYSAPTATRGELVERRGKGRTFYGCTNYPECTFTVSQRPLPESCPECRGILVASGRNRARCSSCSYRGPIPEPRTGGGWRTAVNQVLEEYRAHLQGERNLSPATVRNYIDDLGPFFEFLKSEGMGLEDPLQACMGSCCAKAKRRSIWNTGVSCSVT